MEQKYMIIIGVVLFFVIGTITTVVLLNKKKNTNSSSSNSNDNQPNPPTTWLCESSGCSNKSCNSNNINASASLPSSQPQTCYLNQTTCEQNCTLVQCSNTYPKGYCASGYNCVNGSCSLPTSLPEGIYTISTLINQNNNPSEDTCLSLLSMISSPNNILPMIVGRKQSGLASYVFKGTTQTSTDVYYRYTTGKILQVSSNSANINTNINFNGPDIMLGNNNNQLFDIVVFNNNDGTYTGTIKNTGTNNFICFANGQPDYDNTNGYIGIIELSSTSSPIQFTFTSIQIKPRATMTTDCGNNNNNKGWYNISNQPFDIKNDFCRWVGNNPFGPANSPSNWFACKLAGSNNEYDIVPGSNGEFSTGDEKTLNGRIGITDFIYIDTTTNKINNQSGVPCAVGWKPPVN